MTHADVTSADRSETAAFLAEGRAHLGLELGSTRIKAALVDDRGTVLGTGSHAWENQLVDESWTYSLSNAWSGIQDCYADLVRDVRERHGVELTGLASIGIS
ncbi:MAG: ATPase, partial [Brachybacterium sp.]|nr:ATPase [Brachybacterium sp.]